LGIEPQMHAVFVRGLHAANADALVATLPLDRLGKEVGVSLARLHQCPLTGLDLWTPEDVMTRAMQAAKRLERFDTAYTVPVQMIIHALEERSATHSAIAVTPIHGAFRLSQVLLTNGRCAIIDFDDVKRGNPLIDVASFVAHLLYVQVKGQLSQAQSQVAIQHFCRAYAAHVPWTVDGDVLAWYIAAHVVGQHAEKCLRLAKQNAHAKVVQLLHLAVDLLGKSNDET
jgi:aminoglycoside phosphotransferase (APT) family kinase protein